MCLAQSGRAGRKRSAVNTEFFGRMMAINDDLTKSAIDGSERLPSDYPQGGSGMFEKRRWSM